MSLVRLPSARTDPRAARDLAVEGLRTNSMSCSTTITARVLAARFRISVVFFAFFYGHARRAGFIDQQQTVRSCCQQISDLQPCFLAWVLTHRQYGSGCRSGPIFLPRMPSIPRGIRFLRSLAFQNTAAALGFLEAPWRGSAARRSCASNTVGF